MKTMQNALVRKSTFVSAMSQVKSTMSRQKRKQSETRARVSIEARKSTKLITFGDSLSDGINRLSISQTHLCQLIEEVRSAYLTSVRSYARLRIKTTWSRARQQLKRRKRKRRTLMMKKSCLRWVARQDEEPREAQQRNRLR